jgi:hypothetical protein
VAKLSEASDGLKRKAEPQLCFEGFLFADSICRQAAKASVPPKTWATGLLNA